MERQLVLHPTRAIMHVDSTYPYAYTVRQFLRSKLTDYRYDPKLKRYTVNRKYYKFDHHENRLTIPIEFADELLGVLEGSGHRHQRVVADPAYQPRETNFRMNEGWKDRPLQIDAINYLVNEPGSRKGLQLQPGLGKTYCSIKTIVTLRTVGLVIVSGLVEQWKDAVSDQTNIRGGCYVIRGWHSLAWLMEQEMKPALFIGSLETMREYTQNKGAYQDLPLSYPEFLDYYGIGIKIMDEVHLNFHAITMMDLAGDVPNNVYLTATFTSGDSSTKRIFDRIYPIEIRHGREHYERYVNITFYRYATDVRDKWVMRQRGYSHPRYEYAIYKKPTKFEDYFSRVILPIINLHYLNIRNPVEKMLILVSTIYAVEHLIKRIQREWPELNVLPYIAGSPDSNLDDGVDIIVSTPKSAGTGTDISNLRTALNTISVKAPTTIEQSLGRLRKLKNVTPEYVDIYDNSLTSQVNHYGVRATVYKIRAKRYVEHVIH